MARSGHVTARFQNDPIRRCGARPPLATVRVKEAIIMSKSRLLAGVVLVGALWGGIVLAQGPVIQPVGEAKWGPAPPMLPAGAQIVVLAGDPGKSAPYTVRLKFPANYAIPAHSHPTDENVAVVSGALMLGMGDKLDKAAGTSVGPGGYALAPANMNHYAYTKQETTILLYGIGPVEFKYVNPNDDPRNAKR
jgi:quercetin dioxygenase-like cupin family protein